VTTKSTYRNLSSQRLSERTVPLVHVATWQYQTIYAAWSDWLTVKGMEVTVSIKVEVYCTVISRNYVRGTEEEQEVSQAGLGTSRHRTGYLISTI
jgi:hypothetical protein